MFYLEEKHQVKYYKSSNFDDSGLVHAFTTRHKDFYNSDYNGFSLGVGAYPDLTEIVQKNRQTICEILGIAGKQLVIPDQKHTDNVKIISNIDDDVSETDALITRNPDIVLMLLYADCTPIIIYAPNEKVVGVVHAGWRGTSKKIAQKAIIKMCNAFNVDIKSIKAAIGPAIGQCCYPVSVEVADELKQTIDNNYDSIFLESPKSDKIYVDLKQLNSRQVQEIGVIDIDIINDCTCCNNSTFFSYRAESGKTGRHSAIANIK